MFKKLNRQKLRKPASLFNIFAFTLALVLTFFVISSKAGVSSTQEAVWSSGGPYVGYINSIAVSPSNSGVVYVGTASGVYKSMDHGDNWSRAGLHDIEIEIVRVDPGNPDIVYAVARVGVENGFFRSTNGGTDWTQQNIDRVQTLDIDPNNPQILWAGTDTGRVHRSVNRGEGWTEILHKEYTRWEVGVIVYYDHPITSVLVDPENSSNIFIALDWGDDKAFGKSTDGGQTWDFQKIGSQNPDSAYSLAVTPAGVAPPVLYIVSSGDSSVGYTDAVYMSTDKGATWTILVGYVRTTIYAHPTNPHLLFVGTTGAEGSHLIIVNYSEATWQEADIGLPPAAPSSIAVNPQDTSIAYAGYRLGGWSSSLGLHRSADGGTTWSLSNSGIDNSHIRDIAIHPLDSRAVFTAVSGAGVQQTTTGGHSWAELANSPVDVGTLAIDSNNTSRMFAGTSSGSGYYGSIYLSQDAGGNWTKVDEYNLSGPVRDIWIHPIDADIVLALKEYRTSGGFMYYGGVRRSTDGGTTWSFVKHFNWPTCLAADPNNPDIVYLGVERLGYIFRSTNAGLTWTDISPYQEWGRNVNDVVVDSSSNVYAAITDYEGNALGGIWKWDQSTWSRVVRFDGVDVTALAIDRTVNPAALYAGTSRAGVFLSSNGGMDWEEFNSGLGALNITRLELSHTLPRILYAGANYGGVWSTSVLSGHSIDNPRNFQATAVSTSQISLSWSKNTANNNVMLAWSPGGTFGTPQDGAVYNAGASIPGGGTVLYRGSNTTFNHSGLKENTAYYYRAYSYTAANEYSSGSSASSTTPMGPIASFPWTETFEDNSPTRSGWTQIWESGANSWSYAAGSNGGSITSAYQGTKNARFTGSSGGPHVTKLITPVLNLSSLGNPELSFWYGQEEWEPDQNELRVYYRTSPSASWVELFHDNQNRSTWTKQTLALPNRSGTYQIAFEGVDRWGYANVLDNVTVSGEELVSRIYGSNRYTTAVEVSQTGWPDGAGTVLLARGDNFPDSLAGVSLAYQLNAPILLTPSTSLHDATKQEIERLGASRVIILGGTGAISASVEAELLAMITVHTVDRLGGANRYETAKLIAEELDKGASFDTAFVASGLGFPDALAAASYGAIKGYPIILTAKDSLPIASVLALDNLTEVAKVVIVGGEAVVSTAVEDALRDRGLVVERIWGANRYVTSVELAETYLPEDANEVFIATGLNFPDALAGGVLAAKRNSGILLVPGHLNTLPGIIEDYIIMNDIIKATILGGTSAVSEGIENQLKVLLQ